jgi:hypothetical protein
VNRALRAVKLDGEGDEAHIDLIRHRGKPHSPQMVLRPVAQHALDAHAPHVVVRSFVLSHAL